MVVAIFVAEYIIWLLVLQLSPRITQSLPGATIFMLLTHHVIPVETLLLSCRLVYPEKLMFCLWDWLLTSTSHRSPVSPGGHRHVKPLSPSTHVALLCAHGDDAHSSMLTSQASPEKNSRNETELRKRKKYQVWRHDKASNPNAQRQASNPNAPRLNCAMEILKQRRKKRSLHHLWTPACNCSGKTQGCSHIVRFQSRALHFHTHWCPGTFLL